MKIHRPSSQAFSMHTRMNGHLHSIKHILGNMLSFPSKSYVGVCSTLPNPSNGMVEMTNNTVGSIATYSCFINYMLVGPQNRNCTADIGWSGEDPQCCMFIKKTFVIFQFNFTIFVLSLHGFSENMWWAIHRTW